MGDLPKRLALPLGLLPFSSKQFSINVGDLLQVFLDAMIVADPESDLVHLIEAQCTARGATRPQSDSQIPDRAVPLATGTLAIGVPAREIAFDQGTA
jgi:hypothetical protein